MSTPVDEKLYNEVKREVDKTYTKPSAYRSMAYTRNYMKAFEEKYGKSKAPYKGKKPGELQQWRNEKWIDIKSYIRDPKNPTACGNEPVKKGEYPLCMPEKEAATYSKGELELLRQRKSQIGKRRLVKDAYLRDVLKPEETPPERVYKQKYVKEKKLKIEPLPEKEAEKILKEKPIKETLKKEKVQKVKVPTIEEVTKPAERRARGRPRLPPEVREKNKEATLQRRKEQRAVLKEENAQKRAEVRKAKEEERMRQKAEKEAQPKPEREITRAPVGEPLDSDNWRRFNEYKRRKLQENEEFFRSLR